MTKCETCCVSDCRDDLIFLIYVYQRWIYRVDMTRVNEFGFSGAQQEEREAVAGAAEANGAQPVPALEVRREGGSGCLWLPGLWCRAAHVRSQECTALLTTHD